MSISENELADWLDWARKKFAKAGPYPLIDKEIQNPGLLQEAYDECSDNAAMRERLESRLAHAQGEIATRFVILNYYYGLIHFASDRKEEYISYLRRQFRNDLAFFVRLRAVEDCNGVNNISWEIVNACAIRDWPRARELYLRLRSTEEIALGTFHAAYGAFLFRAAFDHYDPEEPEDDSESLSHWSVSIVEQRSKPRFDDLTFEISMLGLGLADDFALPAGRTDELVRDAKNELEKARDALADFRPGFRSALARCYMARGEYRQAAAEYKKLADLPLDQVAGFQLSELRPWVRASVVTALELAEDDSGLRSFLEDWRAREPQELGPREHLARLEAKRGNYEAAFRYLSEEYSMNPAHDRDWKATLLVELGTRAENTEQVAETVRKSTERNPELQAVIDSVVESYWPTFCLLTPGAKASFRHATACLFHPAISKYAWTPAAAAAGKAVELELRETIFEPFAQAARRGATLPPRANAQGARPEPLVAFIERGPATPLTMGVMAPYLMSVASPKEGVERLLRDWLKVRKPKLYGALTNRKLRDDIVELRNRATHASVTREEATNLYKLSRSWLDELTRDIRL